MAAPSRSMLLGRVLMMSVLPVPVIPDNKTNFSLLHRSAIWLIKNPRKLLYPPSTLGQITPASADAGVICPRVEGGYKSLRGFLINQIADLCSNEKFVLLSGMTGTGKTDIIKTLPRSIDLEGAANHKGPYGWQHLLGRCFWAEF